MAGWIKLHRKIKDSTVFDNPELLKVWIWCLIKATHDDYSQMVGLQEVDLEKGQFIFGRKVASNELKMTESKTYRLIKKLENMQNLHINSNNKFSIITIANWELYQSEDGKSEQLIEQQVNNKRTTNEQQMNTNKNIKNIENIKNNKNKDIYSPTAEIIDYLNMKCGTSYKATSQKTKDLIKSRVNEGYVLEDFIKVIDNKTEEWLHDNKMNKFLRPETLFSNKFEGYLNQKIVTNKQYNTSNPFLQMIQDEMDKEGYANG